jgi:hypothetical protein
MALHFFLNKKNTFINSKNKKFNFTKRFLFYFIIFLTKLLISFPLECNPSPNNKTWICSMVSLCSAPPLAIALEPQAPPLRLSSLLMLRFLKFCFYFVCLYFLLLF